MKVQFTHTRIWWTQRPTRVLKVCLPVCTARLWSRAVILLNLLLCLFALRLFRFWMVVFSLAVDPQVWYSNVCRWLIDLMEARRAHPDCAHFSCVYFCRPSSSYELSVFVTFKISLRQISGNTWRKRLLTLSYTASRFTNTGHVVICSGSVLWPPEGDIKHERLVALVFIKLFVFLVCRLSH